MNQHDLDRQLDLAIDALIREASPAPHEQGDADVFSLVDTARLAKSLRAPAEPDADFVELAVTRIASDLRQSSAAGNGVVPAASAPTIQALPLDGPADESPRGFRSWLSRYSELAAILVVVLLVLGGIFVHQTQYSGDDGAPAIGQEDPHSSPTPDDAGVIRGLTFEEAQELTPFELIRPAYVPGALEYLGLNLFTRPMISSDGTEQRSEPNDATLYYGLAEGELPSSMQIEFQQSRHPHGIRGDGYEESTIEASGRSIVKYHQERADGSRHIIWIWQDGDVSYAIMALIADDETESAIEELISALPEPEGSIPPPADGPVIAIDEAIVERFRKIQAEVDFDVAVPTFLDGFELPEGGANASEPPLPPRVRATWYDNTSQPPRMLHLIQVPEGVPSESDWSSYEQMEDVIILGVETELYAGITLWQDGEELDVHGVSWKMNGITYHLSSTNVDRDTFLEIANSLMYLSELDDAVYTAPPTPETELVIAMDAAIVERFREVQAEVDFDVALPVVLDGFELPENGVGTSGPPLAPGVLANFFDNNSRPPRMLSLNQRPDGLGAEPDRSDSEAEDVVIQGVETTLYTRTTPWQDGQELDIHQARWEMNGVTYDLAATNVDRDTFLEIAGSITPLSELEDAVFVPPPTPSAAPAIQNPVEFVLAYRLALEEQDMDTARNMLVERFRGFNDELLDRGVGVPVDVGNEWDPANWTAEQSEHVTVVRLNDLPVFTYVLRRGANGEWLVDPGAHTHWNMERRANDDFDDYGGRVEGVRVERVSDAPSVELQMLVIINLARVEVHDDNTVDVTVEWMHTRARSGEFPMDGLRWESGDTDGAADITWTTARLSGDTAEFVALPAGLDGAATYFTTFTLYDVPDSGNLQLNVPDVTVIDAEGSEVTFSTIFHFPAAEYPPFTGESEP